MMADIVVSYAHLIGGIPNYLGVFQCKNKESFFSLINKNI